jgi:hypothetical protein
MNPRTEVIAARISEATLLAAIAVSKFWEGVLSGPWWLWAAFAALALFKAARLWKKPTEGEA